MTSKAFKKIMQFIKSKFDKVVPIRRCSIHYMTNSDIPAGMVKFAEIDIQNVYNNYEIVFDVTDTISTTNTKYAHGRVYVNIRHDRDSGIVKNNSFMSWEYTNGSVDYSEYLVAYKRNIQTGITNVQLWTNLSKPYVVRQFNVAYSTTLANPWVDGWKLYDFYGTSTASVPDDYETIISGPGYSIQQLDTVKTLSEQSAVNISSIGLQKKNLLKNSCKNSSKEGINATVNPDGSITLDGKNTNPSGNSIIYANIATGETIINNQFTGTKNTIPPGNYILSGGSSNCRVQLRVSKTPNDEGISYISGSKETPITITEEEKYVWCRIYVLESATVNNETVYPMLRYAEITDDKYEPYVPDLQEQITQTKSQAAINKSSIGLQRKNLLKNTLKSGSSYGITRDVDEFGVITYSGSADGTSTTDYWENVINTVKLPPGRYILNGAPSNSSAIIGRLRVGEISDNSSTTTGIQVGLDVGDGLTFTAEENRTYRISVQFSKNATLNESRMFKPMLRPAEIEDGTYEPYIPDLQEQVNDILSSVEKCVIGGNTINGSNTDLNTIIRSGIYQYFNKPTNSPNQGGYGVLLVLNPKNLIDQNVTDTYVVQIAFESTASSAFKGVFYIRTSSNNGNTWSDWFSNDSSYGLGRVIPDGTDLNSFTTPGNYYSSSQSHTITMKNIPYTTGGFRLEVCDIIGSTGRIQKLYGNSTADGLKVYIRTFVSNVWSSWYQMGLNKVDTLNTTSSVSQTTGMSDINPTS